MVNITKEYHLLFYFIISLFVMEMSLRVGTTSDVLSLEVLISLLFSIALAIIFFMFCTSFESRVNYILSYFLLTLTGVFFFSQFVYFQFFKTFYSLYSAMNVSQIFQFWQDILALIIQNFIWTLLFFLPSILILSLGKRFFPFTKLGWFDRKILICCIVALYTISLVSIYGGGKDQNTAYDLYFKNSNPVLSVKKLGLITTMRLDFQRLSFGWTPILDEPEALDSHPDQTDAVNIDIKEEEPIAHNILDIDFDKLISEEDNELIKKMHNYFANVGPTAKNKYTGKYEGYNQIFIVAESFSPYAVRKDLTPTLYKMVHEGYLFTNFYAPSWDVSTSDGEYVTLAGLIPKGGIWSFTKSASINLPFVLGNQLNQLGYKTVAYHNHTYTYYNRHLSHPNMGYDYKGVGNGLKITEVWPASDLEMMEKSIPEYLDKQPFHAYYLTVSGHKFYSFTGNSMAFKNQSLVKDLPYSEQGQAYLASQIELDKALEYLLNHLEEANIAHKTLIALCTDHYPYGLDESTIDELAGHKVERDFELYKSTFILYTKDMEPVTVDKPTSSLDILPTLSNLLGLEYDSRLLMGKDIFSDSKPLVIFRNRSFITDKGIYNALTKEFIPNEDETITEDYINWISTIIENKFYYSAKILESNYYEKIK